MDESVERQVGDVAVHVSDCYIWAQIQYLDSPTDYREFLPYIRGGFQVWDQLELPNNTNYVPWVIPCSCTIVGSIIVICLLILLKVL